MQYITMKVEEFCKVSKAISEMNQCVLIMRSESPLHISTSATKYYAEMIIYTDSESDLQHWQNIADSLLSEGWKKHINRFEHEDSDLKTLHYEYYFR